MATVQLRITISSPFLQTLPTQNRRSRTPITTLPPLQTHTHTYNTPCHQQILRTALLLLDLWTNHVMVAELLAQWSDRMALNNTMAMDNRTTSVLQEVVDRQQQRQQQQHVS